MTAQTRATLKALFEDGDVPTGGNYADMIDSNINTTDTTAQTIVSKLTMPAANITTVSAGTLFADTVNISTNLVVSGASKFFGDVTAQSLYVSAFYTSGHSKLGSISACDVFFDTVTCSGAMHIRGHVSAKAGISVSGGIDFSLVSAKELVVGDTSSDSSAAATLTVHGPARFNSVVSADDGIIVSGAAKFNGTVSAATLFGSTGSFSSTLKVAGITSAAALFADSIVISGTTKLTGITSAGTLYVDNLIAINDARGHMHIASAGATATNCSATNTFINAKAITTADTLIDISAGNNKLTYIGAVTKEFLVILNVSVSSATNNHDLQIGIAKNGTIIDGSEIEGRVLTGANIVNMGTTEMMSLATDDYITIQIASDTASQNTVHKLNLTMTQI